MQVPWPKFGRLAVPEASKSAFYKPKKWNSLSKQSGVPNVSWHRNHWSWNVQFPTFDENGEKSGNQRQSFSVKKFIKDGLSEEDAEAAALEAAKAFREELVKQGILKEPKPVDPNFTSEVIGSNWDKKAKKWRVELYPTTGKKRIWGGLFTEKAAAEAKALELAKEHGLERRVKAVGKLSELPIFEPKVPYPGVKWNRFLQQWHAQCNVNGHRNFMVKPEDHSEAKLEASFKKAVAWKKKQEKENAKAMRKKMLMALI